MPTIHYEINISPEGFWVGYNDENGEWQNVESSPCDSFAEATTLREIFQAAYENPHQSMTA